MSDVAYNAGLEIRYAIAASGVDPIQHIPEVDAIIERRLAEARKAAFIEAAEMAQNITSAECREIISEEKWVDMTDDYGEHIGQMKQGACFRLNFRKGIAAALRAKAEETGR